MNVSDRTTFSNNYIDNSRRKRCKEDFVKVEEWVVTKGVVTWSLVGRITNI